MPKALFYFVLLFLLISFAVPKETMAQFSGVTSPEQASSITLSPRYPEPNETITISINDYSVNTSGATIQWFNNGAEIPNSKNKRVVEVPSGKLGASMDILAVTTLPNGSVLQAKNTIAPVRIDMLVEADTRVPSFYKGRSIPASGGTVHVTALPFTGKSRSASSYSYTWRVGNEVQAGGSRFGKNSISFTAGFQKQIQVSVDVIDTDGTIVASETIIIPLAEPELYYYEVNPLRGMSEISMGENFVFIGEEIRVRAEPYYIDTALFSQNPHQQWKLDGQTIINPTVDQQELTLRRSGDTGSFTLEYHVRNLAQLLQGVKKSITINF